MKFYKIIENDCIVAVGTDTGGTEITEAEYNTILPLILAKPEAPAGYGYHLRTDLTFELYELPAVEETDPELSAEEALEIIMGGAV